MQMPTMRMTDSTKYAWPVLEPAKRDLRPALPGRLSWRMTIRTMMPTVVSVPIASTYISHGSQSPMNGISQSAWKSWPMALTIVSSRVRKPTATNQCATPTTPQRFMRVWPTKLPGHRHGPLDGRVGPGAGGHRSAQSQLAVDLQEGAAEQRHGDRDEHQRHDDRGELHGRLLVPARAETE